MFNAKDILSGKFLNISSSIDRVAMDQDFKMDIVTGSSGFQMYLINSGVYSPLASLKIFSLNNESFSFLYYSSLKT